MGGRGEVGGVVLQNRGRKGKGNTKIPLKCIKTSKSEIVTPKTPFPKTHTFLTTPGIPLQASGCLRGPALRAVKIVNSTVHPDARAKNGKRKRKRKK